MRIGSNYYILDDSIIPEQKVIVLLLITVAVTLACIARESSWAILYLFAILLNVLHFFTYTKYLQNRFKFAVTKHGLMLLKDGAYTVPWQFVSISKKEISQDKISVYFNISDLECMKNTNKESYEKYVFFRSKSYVLSKDYYFGWHKKLINKKQDFNIKRFLEWKKSHDKADCGKNAIKLTKINLKAHIVLINLTFTMLVYLVCAGLIMLI